MATDPSPDVVLSPLTAEPRPLAEWLTTFHLATVVLDPYTNESSWVLGPARRILEALRGSDARVCFTVTASPAETREFMGPLVDEFLIFTDPRRELVKELGLATLPAFVFVRVDGTVPATAEGWVPDEWRKVADAITATTAWRTPDIPAPGDPGPFHGTPALG